MCHAGSHSQRRSSWDPYPPHTAKDTDHHLSPLCRPACHSSDPPIPRVTVSHRYDPAAADDSDTPCSVDDEFPPECVFHSPRVSYSSRISYSSRVSYALRPSPAAVSSEESETFEIEESVEIHDRIV